MDRLGIFFTPTAKFKHINFRLFQNTTKNILVKSLPHNKDRFAVASGSPGSLIPTRLPKCLDKSHIFNTLGTIWILLRKSFQRLTLTFSYWQLCFSRILLRPTPVAWQSLQITTIVSMRINQAKLCKTMQYHALPMSSETILDKKVLIVLLLKNSREFHFSISISRHFCFTFHFSKRVNQIWISLFTSRSKWRRFFFHFQFSKRVKLIFISLFTSRSEWKRFLFHFSLLEIPISTLAGHC